MEGFQKTCMVLLHFHHNTTTSLIVDKSHDDLQFYNALWFAKHFHVMYMVSPKIYTHFK